MLKECEKNSKGLCKRDSGILFFVFVVMMFMMAAEPLVFGTPANVTQNGTKHYWNLSGYTQLFPNDFDWIVKTNSMHVGSNLDPSTTLEVSGNFSVNNLLLIDENEEIFNMGLVKSNISVFANTTKFSGDIFADIGLRVPLPPIDGVSKVFTLQTNELTGMQFNRTTPLQGQIDFINNGAITHSFFVTGINAGNMFYTGNITGGNLIYGEMYNYSGYTSTWTFPLGVSGRYYNFTNMTAGDVNGFIATNNNRFEGGSYLTAQVEGMYDISFSLSYEGVVAGGQYGFSTVRNFNVSDSRDCYARGLGTTNIVPVTITCKKYFDVGDTINVQIEDEAAPPKNLMIHSANLGLTRIGD